MKLDDQRRSDNIEDQRGQGGGLRMPGGGGGFRIGRGGGGLSLGMIALLVIFAFLFRINPLELLSGGGGMPATQVQTEPGAQPTDKEGDFVRAILGSTEDVWTKLFSEGALSYYGATGQYVQPRLVLFDGSVSSGCGSATAAVGPFYCPADSKLYLDTAFFKDLSSRFGAPGDFAQAYVIAHEAGHHIQNLIGVAAQAEQARSSMGGKQYNVFQVKMELQADCFAGVWGYHAQTWKNQLEPGDIDEALVAANAIGDDRLQKQGQGYVVPDSFTHGTSEQRQRWFKKGFDTGDPKQCDTFKAASL